MNGFQGRVALVTGGAAGIGAACVRRLAAQGADVIIADIADATGAALAAEVGRGGGRARFVHTDVSDPLAWERLAAIAHADHGPVDVLVSNAYLLIPGAADELSVQDWNRQIAVNLTALFLAARTFAPDLTARRGTLVAVSSVHALFGLAGRPAYAASKGGITSLVRQLAAEYGPAVRVNAVLPGPIRTDVWLDVPAEEIDRAGRATTLARLGSPDEVAAAVSFLAGDDSSYITGVSLLVDGGWTITKDSP